MNITSSLSIRPLRHGAWLGGLLIGALLIAGPARAAEPAPPPEGAPTAEQQEAAEKLHGQATQAYLEGNKVQAIEFWREAHRLAPHWKYAYNLSNALYEVGNPIDSWYFIREAEDLGLPARYFDKLGEQRSKIQLDLLKTHAYFEVSIDPATELVVTLDGEPFKPPFTKWIDQPTSRIVISREGFVTHEQELAHAIGQRHNFEIRLELAPAMLIVTGTPAGATVRLDGNVIGELPEVGPVPIAQGMHDVHAALDGFKPATEQIELAAGQNAHVNFELLKVDTGLSRQTVGWITAGTGAAAAIGGVVLLFVADDIAADLNQRNKDPGALNQVPYDVYRDQFTQDESRYQDFRLAGFISLGVGAAAIITGVTLALWPESEKDEEAPAPEDGLEEPPPPPDEAPPDGVEPDDGGLVPTAEDPPPVDEQPSPGPTEPEDGGIIPEPLSFSPVPGGFVLSGGFTF